MLLNGWWTASSLFRCLVPRPESGPYRRAHDSPPRRIRVEDIDAVVASLRARGAELVGALERYEDSYRLCYVRGPEGIIIELAEKIG
jgi:catechol 2,3-dioxygenase-like lactoylglutathione lyase family enzyme